MKRLIELLLLRMDPIKRMSLIEPVYTRSLEEVYKNPYNATNFDYTWFKYSSRTQSEIFYIDILNELSLFLRKYPRGSKFKVLDVGSSTGGGAELLGKIFYSYFTGYKLEVDAIDIEDTYVKLSPYYNKHISYLQKDLFEVENDSYDIVICSHTIEHIESNVEEFFNKLRSVSSKILILNMPYKEESLIPGHFNHINDAFIATKLPNPTSMRVFKSLGWHKDDEVSDCVILTYEKNVDI